MEQFQFLEGLSPGEFVELIWVRHYGTLELYVRGFCKGNQLRYLTIEDVLHDFFLTMLEKHALFLPGYRDTGLPYLLRALRNQLINFDRKKKDQNLPGDGPALEQFDALVDRSSPTFSMDLEFFYSLLDRYLKMDSQLIKLWIGKFSYKEIADMLEMNINTVGVKIKRWRPVVEELYGMSFQMRPRRDQK